MLARMRWGPALVLGLLTLLGSGCATIMPQRGTVRDASAEERAAVGRLLVPLLITSGIWTGPADGCAAALGILPVKAINLGVGPHPQCKFALVITEEALTVLPARRALRGPGSRDRARAAGALRGAPRAPLPAIGVAETQMVTDSSIEGASLGLSTAGSTASILWWVCFAKMHRKSEK